MSKGFLIVYIGLVFSGLFLPDLRVDRAERLIISVLFLLMYISVRSNSSLLVLCVCITSILVVLDTSAANFSKYLASIVLVFWTLAFIKRRGKLDDPD